MSEENVEIVRNFYAVHSRGDAAFWDLFPPDFVWDFSQQVGGPGVLSRDQARAEYDRMRYETFEEGRFRLEPKELIDAGDKVLAFVSTSGRAKSSGDVEISGHIWTVWTFRDGKPVEWTFLGLIHRATALEAVGLRD